ncbi:WD40-repeat-containing domain protein [Lentinula edodes]|nr:WD40-repeat-containing domain protein [Lentinula edodes]
MPLSTPYNLFATLGGLRDAVLSVNFSAHGKFISAAGYNGVIVWDLETSLPVALPIQRFHLEKPEHVYPASVWIYFNKSSRHVLLLGSLDGQITAWDWNSEAMTFECVRLPVSHHPESQILSLDVHQLHVETKHRARIIASFADRSVKSWTVSPDGNLNHVFTVQMEDFIPKSVRFHTESRNIYIFAMKGGKRVLLDYQTGAIISCIDKGCDVMASVSLDQPRNRFVTYSGLDFQLFSLANLSHIRTYQDEPPIISYPKQVAFAENGTKIVAGTDRGKVLIYNTESGQLDQTLIYVKGNLVQPVAAASFDGMHYIAAAGSTLKMPSEVLVWRNSSLDISTKRSAGNAFIQTPKLNEDPIIFSLRQSTGRLLIRVLTCIFLMSLMFFLILAKPVVKVPPVMISSASILRISTKIPTSVSHFLETHILSLLGLAWRD